MKEFFFLKTWKLAAFVVLFLIYLFPHSLPGQRMVFVDSVTIEGHKKTRLKIIFRELSFAVGDSIAVDELPTKLKESEKHLMNTSLFTNVIINIKNWEGDTDNIHIHIIVEETWYFYPVPIIELVDRNFNVWWVDHHHSFRRLNYGLDLTHTNFTGRFDKLKIKAQYGYTRKYSLIYKFPYIDKAQKLGVLTEIVYSREREVNYMTIANKQEFYRNDSSFIRKRFRAEAGLSFRPALFAQHEIILRYHNNYIGEYVAKHLNPNYFLDGKTQQQYFTLSYNFRLDKRDIKPYPLNGYAFGFNIEKDGLGIFDDRNALTIKALGEYHFPLSKKWFFGLEGGGKLSLIRARQPYNDNFAFGFSQSTLHGYEYYITDGLDMVFLKSSFKFKLWENEVNFGRLSPIEAFRKMPFKFFLTFNNDTGYSNGPYVDSDNFLNRKLLWGGGIGLDFVFFFDKVFSIEYSFNHLGEGGLFLHVNTNL